MLYISHSPVHAMLFNVRVIIIIVVIIITIIYYS